MSAWIQIANSNSDYFNNSKESDVILRTNISTQNILISPFNSNGENATLQVTNTGVNITGDIVLTGGATIGDIVLSNGIISNTESIYSSNISTSIINLSSNQIIKYDETDGKIKFGVVGELVNMGDTVGLLYGGSNLKDIVNVVAARSNIGLGLTNSVAFSNVDVSGNFFKNGVLFEGGSGGADEQRFLDVIPTTNKQFDIGIDQNISI